MPKTHGSRDAMEHTAATSPFYDALARAGARSDLAAAEAALASRDLDALGDDHRAQRARDARVARSPRAPAIIYWQPATLALLAAVRDAAPERPRRVGDDGRRPARQGAHDDRRCRPHRARARERRGRHRDDDQRPGRPGVRRRLIVTARASSRSSRFSIRRGRGLERVIAGAHARRHRERREPLLVGPDLVGVVRRRDSGAPRRALPVHRRRQQLAAARPRLVGRGDGRCCDRRCPTCTSVP